MCPRIVTITMNYSNDVMYPRIVTITYHPLVRHIRLPLSISCVGY